MATKRPGRVGADERQERLEADLRLLDEHYPELTVERAGGPVAAIARGPLKVALPDGRTEEIEVRIEFARRHPRTQPQAYDAAERWDPDPDRHIEPDHRFCLDLAGFEELDLAEPRAILKYVKDLEMFLYQQRMFDHLRKHDPDAEFPGPEHPHGPAAYVLAADDLLQQQPEAIRQRMWEWPYLSDDEPCLCGSDQAYRECHRPVKKQLIDARDGGRGCPDLRGTSAIPG